MPRDESTGLRAAQLRLGRLPGYVRQPDLARRGGEDGHTYKKGWEVRFTARTEQEIAEIRELVIAAGFAPARPFFKGHQLIQPVYGIAAVQAYLAARAAAEDLARERRDDPAIPEQVTTGRALAERALGERAVGERAVGELSLEEHSLPARPGPVGTAAAIGAQRARRSAEHQVSAPPAGRTS